MARKTGLGRGLDALIPVDRPSGGYASLRLDRIEPNPLQPRTHFDEAGLDGLAASIREVGVLQPVIVRPGGDEGSYVLIAGERRCRAARMAGLEEIPALIREEHEATTTLAEALIENVQREDLTVLEEAAAYRQLMDDFGLTHEQIAQRVGKSRSSVTNILRLLQLPSAIQGLLERGELTTGHAKALLGVDEAKSVGIARKAASEGWSVRQVEDSVRATSEDRSTRPPVPSGPEVRPAAVIELEQRLADHLGTKVRIDFTGDRGKLVVRFADLDDLERIYRAFFG